MAQKVNGVHDHELHPELHEAHRVLVAGIDAFQKTIDQVEGQFVRPLLNANDGVGSTDAAIAKQSRDIQQQISAFRRMYATKGAIRK